MSVKIYSIYDRLAGVYSDPFVALRDELAIRRFVYLMHNAEMVAEDCDLYSLGVFDTDNGTVVGADKPLFVYRYTKQLKTED